MIGVLLSSCVLADAAPSSPARMPATVWSWPVHGRVTSAFGPRRGKPHEGIDLGAPQGSPVVASRVGRVQWAGPRGGYGQLVELDHGNGWTSRYAHLSGVAVRRGQIVGAGQRIGAVGQTGRSTGPHVHFEIRWHGRPLDPARLVR